MSLYSIGSQHSRLSLTALQRHLSLSTLQYVIFISVQWSVTSVNNYLNILKKTLLK